MSERTAPPPGEDRLREGAVLALSKAALQIVSGLDLGETLQQIAESARDLLQAEYCALGVFDQDRVLHEFITSGIDQDQIAAIDHPPVGAGLLGAVMDEGSVIRLPDLSVDPRSVGFPEGHPEMRSFLGAPILADDRVLGNIYLTNRIGRDEFTEEDVVLIQSLANHAAAALLNVELHQEVIQHRDDLARRNRELTAVQSVSRAASDPRDLQAVLETTLDEVFAVTGMQAGEIYLLAESKQTLDLICQRGVRSAQLPSIPSMRVEEGLPGRAVSSGKVLVSQDLASGDGFAWPAIQDAGFQSFVILPIVSKARPIGTLDLAAKHIREFSAADLRLLEAVANQIGLAIENAHLYEEVSRLAVVEERARIGMDLHDGVIQSIYAVGLSLETAQIIMEQQPVQARALLGKAIDGLNEAIRDIRNFILDLRPRKFHGDLKEGINRLVREFQANAMIEVDSELDPKSLHEVPAPIAAALFMTTQEALANISRHARASHVSLQIRSFDDRVQMVISDDGQGFDIEEANRTVGHGIANMGSRARELEGDFKIDSSPESGTTISLTLPSNPPTRRKPPS